MDWHIDWDGADVVIVGPGSVEVVLRGVNGHFGTSIFGH